MPTDNMISISDISGARRSTSRNLASLTSSTSQPRGLGLLQPTSGVFQTDEHSILKAKIRGTATTQSFMMGSSFSFIRSKLMLFIGDAVVVDDLLATDATSAEILNFLKSDGPKKLTFFFQVGV